MTNEVSTLNSLDIDATNVHPVEEQSVVSAVEPPQANVSPGQPPEIQTRRPQYLITSRRGSGLHPMQVTNMTAAVLQNMDDVKLLKRLKPSGLSTFSTMGSAAEVLVAETTVARGLELQRTANQDLIVEPNHFLIHLGSVARNPSSQSISLAAAGPGVPVKIQF